MILAASSDSYSSDGTKDQLVVRLDPEGIGCLEDRPHPGVNHHSWSRSSLFPERHRGTDGTDAWGATPDSESFPYYPVCPETIWSCCHDIEEDGDLWQCVCTTTDQTYCVNLEGDTGGDSTCAGYEEPCWFPGGVEEDRDRACCETCGGRREVTCYKDQDGDGFGSGDPETFPQYDCPEGYSPNDADCNDDDPKVNPAARENCEDGIDNDCDGSIDFLDDDCPNCLTYGLVYIDDPPPISEWRWDYDRQHDCGVILFDVAAGNVSPLRPEEGDFNKTDLECLANNIVESRWSGSLGECPPGEARWLLTRIDPWSWNSDGPRQPNRDDTLHACE